MKKIATITPINCITKEEDGEEFAVHWDGETGILIAHFASGEEENLGYAAQTAEEAVNIVHSLYAASGAYIYNPEEVDT